MGSDEWCIFSPQRPEENMRLGKSQGCDSDGEWTQLFPAPGLEACQGCHRLERAVKLPRFERDVRGSQRAPQANVSMWQFYMFIVRCCFIVIVICVRIMAQYFAVLHAKGTSRDRRSAWGSLSPERIEKRGSAMPVQREVCALSPRFNVEQRPDRCVASQLACEATKYRHRA